MLSPSPEEPAGHLTGKTEEWACGQDLNLHWFSSVHDLTSEIHLSPGGSALLQELCLASLL